MIRHLTGSAPNSEFSEVSVIQLPTEEIAAHFCRGRVLKKSIKMRSSVQGKRMVRVCTHVWALCTPKLLTVTHEASIAASWHAWLASFESCLHSAEHRKFLYSAFYRGFDSCGFPPSCSRVFNEFFRSLKYLTPLRCQFFQVSFQIAYPSWTTGTHAVLSKQWGIYMYIPFQTQEIA